MLHRLVVERILVLVLEARVVLVGIHRSVLLGNALGVEERLLGDGC